MEIDRVSHPHFKLNRLSEAKILVLWFPRDIIVAHQRQKTPSIIGTDARFAGAPSYFFPFEVWFPVISLLPMFPSGN